MNKKEFNNNAGQVLVQVAIMVGVLFAFLALALDGGHFYVERRRMQNAADAGALAGARELCFGEPSDAKTTAEYYAINRNDAQWATVDVMDDFTVSVVAGETMDTFFAGLIGIHTADVSAEAAAVCGKVTRLCGLWPIGMSVTNVVTADCGNEILIWEDDIPDCETYSCTCYHGVPGAKEVKINSQARTWLDFSAVMFEEQTDPCDQGGCGADELKDRIHGETFYNNPGKSEDCLSFINIPGCTPADSGVKASVVKAAEDHISECHWIPLYDPIKTGCTVTSTSAGSTCGSKAITKYIVDVLCIRLTGVCRLCLQSEDPTANCNGPRVLQAEVICGDNSCCSAGCGATSGEKPGPGDVKAVSLVK